MKHVMVPFSVKLDSLDKAKDAIGLFIRLIKENEPKTILYKSFQQTDEPTRFVHIMTFFDDSAENHHRQTNYCREFVEKLYPLCEEIPKPIVYNEIS